MPSALTSTYGVWLVSLFLETILYGCGVLQTWLYFHWYSNDHWGIQLMVMLLFIFETLQISFFFSSTYKCLIDNFGNLPFLFVINWEDSAQLMAGYLSSFTVQIYFAYCIYVLDKKKFIPPILITILALTQIGAGIAQTTITTELGSFLKLDSTKPITTLQSAATLACDILITTCLVRTLNQHKTNLRTSTNSMLNMLMINAVNRGMLTALGAALNMILFLSLPGTFYFFLGLMPASKLYMNSALATLNSRQHIINKSFATSNTQGWNSIPIGTVSTLRTAADTNQIQVTVDSETYEGDYNLGKKNTFISGMV